MSETLGKIEKPETSQFKENRKLLFVPIMFIYPSEDTELSQLLQQYWQETEQQVNNLCQKLGKITKVYHELISSETELALLDNMHIGSHNLVKKNIESGASFQPLEDADLLSEFMDWSRCLSIGIQSSKVFNAIYQNYIESNRKRNEQLSKKLDETLTPEDIGLLFLREEHHVQFPPDIQVFFVAPPSLDTIHRHLRDKQELKSEAGEKTDNQAG